MDASSVSPNPNFVTTQVLTNVEKSDKEKSQIKPVASGSESANISLGDKELHGENGDTKRSDKTNDFEAMQKIAQEIQDRLDMIGSTLGFSINKKYEKIVAEITNRESGDLIKQIPSEEVLELRKKIEELVGIFFDQNV